MTWSKTKEGRTQELWGAQVPGLQLTPPPRKSNKSETKTKHQKQITEKNHNNPNQHNNSTAIASIINQQQHSIQYINHAPTTILHPDYQLCISNKIPAKENSHRSGGPRRVLRLKLSPIREIINNTKHFLNFTLLLSSFIVLRNNCTLELSELP